MLTANTTRVASGIAKQCLEIPIEEDVECYKDAIHRFLQSWVTAWGKGNLAAYLNHYVQGVSPDPDLSAGQWQEERRKMVAGKTATEISLELESMMVDETGVTEVIFTQSCLAPNCSDPVLKVLSLIRSGNTFKIQREFKIRRSGVGTDTN